MVTSNEMRPKCHVTIDIIIKLIIWNLLKDNFNINKTKGIMWNDKSQSAYECWKGKNHFGYK